MLCSQISAENFMLVMILSNIQSRFNKKGGGCAWIAIRTQKKQIFLPAVCSGKRKKDPAGCSVIKSKDILILLTNSQSSLKNGTID